MKEIGIVLLFILFFLAFMSFADNTPHEEVDDPDPYTRDDPFENDKDGN